MCANIILWHLNELLYEQVGYSHICYNKVCNSALGVGSFSQIASSLVLYLSPMGSVVVDPCICCSCILYVSLYPLDS